MFNRGRRSNPRPKLCLSRCPSSLIPSIEGEPESGPKPFLQAPHTAAPAAILQFECYTIKHSNRKYLQQTGVAICLANHSLYILLYILSRQTIQRKAAEKSCKKSHIRPSWYWSPHVRSLLSSVVFASSFDLVPLLPIVAKDLDLRSSCFWETQAHNRISTGCMKPNNWKYYWNKYVGLWWITE